MIIRFKPAPPHHPGHPAHRPDRLAAPLTNVIDHLHFHDIRHHQPVKTIHHDLHHDQKIIISMCNSSFLNVIIVTVKQPPSPLPSAPC